LRVNEAISAKEVRVVGKEGKQLGIMEIGKALEIARKEGLDLIEIAPQASPPVCRVIDYGKFRYQQEKRQREAKKKLKAYEIKQVKMRIEIGEHDYQVKKRLALKFLGRGDKVKVTIMFLGRQRSHPELGRRLLDRLIEETKEIAEVETSPRLLGYNMIMVLKAK
jgi:translation initiation factor IF-3